MSKLSLKKNAQLIHKWIGLASSIWLVLMAISGLPLVWHEEIDRVLNQDIMVVESGEVHVPISQMVKTAESAFPNYEVVAGDLPNRAVSATSLELKSRDPEANTQGILVYFDPYSGQMTGHRFSGKIGFNRRQLMESIYEFHYNLFLGSLMGLFLGGVAILWAISQLFSLVLAFPKLRLWRRSFTFAKGAKGPRLTIDLHRVVGLWLLPASLLVSLSAFMLQWEGVLFPSCEECSSEPSKASVEMPVSFDADPLSIDQAVAIVELQAKDQIDAFDFDDGVYNFYVFSPKDLDKYGRLLVTVDPRIGKIVYERHERDGSFMHLIMSAQYGIHSGQILGLFGKLIVFLIAVTVMISVYTGMKMWLRRRRLAKTRTKPSHLDA